MLEGGETLKCRPSPDATIETGRVFSRLLFLMSTFCKATPLNKEPVHVTVLFFIPMQMPFLHCYTPLHLYDGSHYSPTYESVYLTSPIEQKVF